MQQVIELEVKLEQWLMWGGKMLSQRSGWKFYLKMEIDEIPINFQAM